MIEKMKQKVWTYFDPQHKRQLKHRAWSEVHCCWKSVKKETEQTIMMKWFFWPNGTISTELKKLNRSASNRTTTLNDAKKAILWKVQLELWHYTGFDFKFIDTIWNWHIWKWTNCILHPTFLLQSTVHQEVSFQPDYPFTFLQSSWALIAKRTKFSSNKIFTVRQGSFISATLLLHTFTVLTDTNC